MGGGWGHFVKVYRGETERFTAEIAEDAVEGAITGLTTEAQRTHREKKMEC